MGQYLADSGSGAVIDAYVEKPRRGAAFELQELREAISLAGERFVALEDKLNPVLGDADIDLADDNILASGGNSPLEFEVRELTARVLETARQIDYTLRRVAL